ncbi:MAG: hypothetical protein EKK29_19700 [Hyphomicrobiales bacterium]|nr:MAG: hypothetical protein EKK29_19700 [Hyphomicrobiales bacterium]
MDIQDQATAALEEIAAVERRTRNALVYRRASAFLFLWGIVVAIGAALNQAFPDRSEAIWYSVDVVGVLGTTFLAFRRAQDAHQSDLAALKIVASLFVLCAYGAVWSYLLAPAGHDRLAVFWSTLMMMGYVVIGVWQGPLFVTLGVGGTVLSLAAYFLAGCWLHLWIGGIFVLAFVLGGLLLHRQGVGES